MVLSCLSITPNFKSFSPFHYLDMNLMWLILFTGEELKPLLTAPFKQPINFSSTKCEFLYIMHYLLVATSSEFISRNVIRNTLLFLSWELSCCAVPFFPDPLRETRTGFVVNCSPFNQKVNPRIWCFFYLFFFFCSEVPVFAESFSPGVTSEKNRARTTSGSTEHNN